MTAPPAATVAAGGLPEDHDVGPVAAEDVDVPPHPAQCSLLVLHGRLGRSG